MKATVGALATEDEALLADYFKRHAAERDRGDHDGDVQASQSERAPNTESGETKQ